MMARRRRQREKAVDSKGGGGVNQSTLPAIFLNKVRSLGASEDLSLRFLKSNDVEDRPRRLHRPAPAVNKNVAATTAPPTPEEEEEEEEGEEGLLAKYLDRPELVREVLSMARQSITGTTTTTTTTSTSATEAVAGSSKANDQAAATTPATKNMHVATGISAGAGGSKMKSKSVRPITLPEGFRMPTYQVVTPRTRKKIIMLPAPNEDDFATIDAVEMETKAEPEDDNEEDMDELRRQVMMRGGSPTGKRKAEGGGEYGGLLKRPYSPAKGPPIRDLDDMHPGTPGGNDMDHNQRLDRRIRKLREQLEAGLKARTEAEGRLAKELEALRKEQDAVGEAARRKRDLILRMVIHLQDMHAYLAQRHGVVRWRRYVKAIILEQQNKAALVIQRALRQMEAKVMVTAMRRLSVQQQERRRSSIQRRVDLYQSSAVAIQRAFWRWQAYRAVHRMREERDAVSMIIRNYRTMQEYNKAKFMKLVMGKRDKAVVKIQCCWRQYWARVRLRLLRKIRAVRLKEESRARYEARRLEHFRRAGAALTLQRFWRRVRMGKRQQLLMKIIRQRQAVIMQKYYRRYRARKLLERLRKELVKEERRRSQAAFLIQRQVRMYLGKCHVDRIRFQLEKRALVRHLQKAEVRRTRIAELGVIKIDTWKLGHARYWLLHGLDPRWSRIRRDAATDIQRLFRGHRARRRVKLLWELRRFLTYDRAMRKRRKAIIDLQRVYRGRMGRRIAHHARQLRLTLIMQKLWRGHVCRREYHELQADVEAAIILQKFGRRYIARKDFKRRIVGFRQQTRGATRIEALARGYLARSHLRTNLEHQRCLLDRYHAAVTLQALRMCMASHRLLLDSFYGGFKYKVKYGKKTYDGVAKDMFLHFAQSKDEDRLENTGFINMMRQSPGLLSKSFTETDADIIFTRLKEPNTKYITFASWLSALDTLGASLYADVKRYHHRRGRDARLLTVVCEHLMRGSWCRHHVATLNERVRIFVHLIWSRVQALIRGWCARVRYRRRLANLDEERRQAKVLRATIVMQAFARRVHARRVAVDLARGTYVKYVDPVSHLPYWYLPKYKRSVWVKPKIFGPFDVARAKRLPDRSSEFLILCVNCDAARSSTFCESCEEAFCQDCFDGIHLKGHKKEHVGKPVRMCVECEYQTATKSCSNCFLKSGGKPSTYCDTCYWNIHDTEASKRHRYEALVMECVECERHAARWRCLDCADLYCTKCFSKVHARGKKIQHRYEALRYYTSKMHESYELDVKLMELKRDMTKHMALIAQIQAEKKRKCATKIQAAYRGLLGRRKGRMTLRYGRRKMREYYRQRKADNVVRNGPIYQLRDLLTLAPSLPSDTTEEKVTHRFPIWLRSRVSRIVRANVEFQPGMLPDRKKVAKKGFAYGTVQEMLEQGFYGGVRLPGYWSIREGDRIIHGTMDLRKLLNKRARVRIKDLHFSVDTQKGVEPGAVYINRLWRRDSVEHLVIYRMPDLTRSQQITHFIKWYLFATVPVQVAVSMRASINKRISMVFESMVMQCKVAGLTRLAEILKGYQDYHDRQTRRICYLLNEYQDRYSQSVDGSEEEPSLEEEAEALAVKDAARRKEFENKYIKKEESRWEDGKDPRTGKRFWKNKDTGEITYKNPLLGGEANKDEMTVAQQKLLEAKKKREEMKKRRG